MQVRSVLLAAALGAAVQSNSSLALAQAPDSAPAPVPASVIPPRIAEARLPAGTAVIVMTNQELSTKLSHVGDSFGVTVLKDVTDGSTVVIPKGTTGSGEVTFSTNNGGFGKPGILSIALRHLELNGTRVALDGHYREEGANKNGATVATWFAVGVFSGFIRGKPGFIPQGRELKAHTGEDIVYPVFPRPAITATAATAAPSAPPPAKLSINTDPKTGESK